MTAAGQSNTYALILGASEFPRTRPGELDPSHAFSNSAHAFKEYLLSPSGLKLPPENICDTFDFAGSVSDLDDLICEFASSLLDVPDKNLIVYFVGHGTIANDGRYLLMIRSSAIHNKNVSGYRIVDLCQQLRRAGQDTRFFVIIDACFAAKAIEGFIPQSGGVDAIEVETYNALKSGVTLLAASSANSQAWAPKTLKYTMFSDALLGVLRKGIPGYGELLSFSDIHGATDAQIFRRYNGKKMARPELHDPDQGGGGILSRFPIFRNVAHVELGLPSKLLEQTDIVHPENVAFQGSEHTELRTSAVVGSEVNLLTSAVETIVLPETPPSLLPVETTSTLHPADSKEARPSVALPIVTRRLSRTFRASALPLAAVVVFAGALSWWLPQQTPADKPPVLETEEALQWIRTTALDTAAAYQAFISDFPRSRYLSAARSRLDAKNREVAAKEADELAWQEATRVRGRASYEAYLKSFPSGAHVSEANTALVRIDKEEALAIEDDKAWTAARSAGDRASLNGYITRFAQGRHVAEATSALQAVQDAENLASALAADTAAWESARAIGTRSGIESYLANYPSGAFVTDAQTMLAAIARVEDVARAKVEDEKSWRAADNASTTESYESYLKEYPMGLYASDAKAKIEAIWKVHSAALLRQNDDAAWSTASADGTRGAFEKYLSAFPNGLHRAESLTALDELDRSEKLAAAKLADKTAWNTAETMHSIAAYEAYVAAFPRGDYVKKSKDMIATMRKDSTPVGAQPKADKRTNTRVALDEFGCEPGKLFPTKNAPNCGALRK